MIQEKVLSHADDSESGRAHLAEIYRIVHLQSMDDWVPRRFPRYLTYSLDTRFGRHPISLVVLRSSVSGSYELCGAGRNLRFIFHNVKTSITEG